MSGRFHLGIFVLACLLGLMFASVSTFDFAQHLDRQVHDLHCSFIPGQAVAATDGATAGCQLTLMSPYSSVFRRHLWGGLPISLVAMATFAFLGFRGIDLLLRPRAHGKSGAAVLLWLSLIPIAASAVMGTLAVVELEAACKLCIGIYGASIVGLLAAGLAFASIRRNDLGDEAAPSVWLLGLGALVQLGVFVAVSSLAWVAMLPRYDGYAGACGRLESTDDPGGVMVALDNRAGQAVGSIEVFDPLCPACRAFDKRLEAAGLDQELHRRAVLFPLDHACNWMVDEALHPGACTVSEAILCADAGKGPTVSHVIAWAFAHQEEIRSATKDDPEAARKLVLEQYPELKSCIGSPEVRARLNQSLRWAVQNSIPVLTPQLYVGGAQLCPEDTDLGLEYSLTTLLRHQGDVQ